MKKIAFVLLAAFFVASCGPQDPLDGQEDWVRGATKPGARKPDNGSKIIQADEMRIIASSSPMLFTEGAESTFSFTGQVLKKDSTFKLSSRNLSQFPGATFDPKSGEFKWTPARGFVGGDTGKDYILTLMIEAVQKGDPTLYSREVSFVLRVTRAEGVPTITYVEDLMKTPILEGRYQDFIVKVKDEDALDQSPPSLAIVPGTTSTNISSLVNLRARLPERDPSDKTTWIFKLQVDVSNAEVTRGNTVFSFGLIAYNRYGKSTAVRDTSVRIWTSLTDPVAGVKQLNIEATKQTIYTFSIEDKKDEGNISFTVPRLDNLPGNPKQLTCNSLSHSNVQCTLIWTPDLTAINRDYTIRIQVVNRSPISGDTRVRNKEIVIPIRVVAPVSTTTTTASTTTSTISITPPMNEGAQ